MAEIHLLPESFSPTGAKQAVSSLKRAIEAGHDLGERSHHIRAIGHALTAAHQQLRQNLDDIIGDPYAMSAVYDEDLQKLFYIATIVEQTASIARAYQPEIFLGRTQVSSV